MTHSVLFTPEALNQLDKLEIHIAETGSLMVAAQYVDSIVDYCEICEPSRIEAHGAMIFGPACGRLGIAAA